MSQDLYREMQLLLDRLDYSVKSIRETGAAYAKSYHDYRVALANHILSLKADKVPATLATIIARGEAQVAKYKYDEIANEAIYKANLEAINATKLKIRVVEAQIAREHAEVQGL